MASQYLLPVPFQNFVPKIYGKLADAGIVALSDKADEHIRRWEQNTLDLAKLRSVEMIDARFLEEFNTYLRAGVFPWDDERNVRKKIHGAVRSHRQRGTFEIDPDEGDVKNKILDITGIEPSLMEFIRADIFTWVLCGADGSEASTKWALMDGGDGTQRLGLGLVTDGTELEIQGVVYIDLGSGDLDILTLERIKLTIEDSIPAYFRVFLGYRLDTALFWSKLDGDGDVTSPQIGNPGTVTGVSTYAAGRFGNGLSGNGAHIRFDEIATIVGDLVTPFTITFWWRPGHNATAVVATVETLAQINYGSGLTMSLGYDYTNQEFNLFMRFSTATESFGYARVQLGYDWTAGDDVFIALVVDHTSTIRIFLKNYTTGADSLLMEKTSGTFPATPWAIHPDGGLLNFGQPSLVGILDNPKVLEGAVDDHSDFEAESSISGEQIANGILPFTVYPDGVIG